MQRPGCSKMTESNARRGEREKPGNQEPFRIGREDACLAAAISGTRLHSLPTADLYRGLVARGCCAHPLLDLTGHGKECLLNVAGVLGRGLEEWDAEAVCELL